MLGYNLETTPSQAVQVRQQAGMAKATEGTAPAAQEELLATIPALEIVVVRALGPSDDARDAVQEVITRALGVLEADRLPAGVRLGAFVHGIARHVIADVLRARRSSVATPFDERQFAAPGPNILDSLVRAEDLAALRSALAKLPRSDVALLRRCFVDGETIATVARLTGEPASRLRKRKSRALAHLRGLLRRLPESHIIEPAPKKKT